MSKPPAPECRHCGLPSIARGEDAILYLEGQWHDNNEMGCKMFVLQPSYAIGILQLPDGQIALAFEGYPKGLSGHEACLVSVEDQVVFEDEDEDEDEEDEDEL